MSLFSFLLERNQFNSHRFSEDDDWDDNSDDLQREFGDSDSDDDDDIELRGLISGKTCSASPSRRRDIVTQAWVPSTHMRVTILFLLISSLSFVFIFRVLRKKEEVGVNNTSNDRLEKGGNLTIERISILGERNSGVEWITEKITKCYPNLEVQASLARPAHWFQSIDLYDASKPTLVLQVVLNPYDWVEAMRTSPQNMSQHMNMEWEDFVSQPWGMQRPMRDSEYLNKNNIEDTACQMNFSYNEIIPCVVDDNERTISNSVYELNVNSDGTAYKNILELRSAKIHNHLMVQSWPNIKSHIVVLYEDMRKDGGFQRLMNSIHSFTGAVSSCNKIDPSLQAPMFWKGHAEPAFEYWVTVNNRWQNEYMIGYDEKLELRK